MSREQRHPGGDSFIQDLDSIGCFKKVIIEVKEVNLHTNRNNFYYGTNFEKTPVSY